MVSLKYPTPPAQDLYTDPMEMGLPSLRCLPPSSNDTTATIDNAISNGVWSSEDPNKKVRKPYTITKSRETWTEQEHDKFLEALQLFDRDWKKIEAFVGSKTAIQIRSHAQKYFLKVQKNGTSEHVPPPRPKRKAAHPYPHKASKHAPVVSQITGPLQSSGVLLEPGYVLRPDSLSQSRNPIDEVEVTRPAMAHNCCSCINDESTQRMWPTGGMKEGKGKLSKPVRVIPDFAQVYSFIGSVFDPNAIGHLQKFKSMDPINVETILLLMKNLSVNLTSPEFEDHRRLLSSYDVDAEKAKSSSLYNNLHISKLVNAIPTV